MTVAELIARLQSLVALDPTIADRIVMVQGSEWDHEIAGKFRLERATVYGSDHLTTSARIAETFLIVNADERSLGRVVEGDI